MLKKTTDYLVTKIIYMYLKTISFKFQDNIVNLWTVFD